MKTTFTILLLLTLTVNLFSQDSIKVKNTIYSQNNLKINDSFKINDKQNALPIIDDYTIERYKVLSEKEKFALEKTLKNDKDWNLLNELAIKKGYTNINAKEAKFGFNCELVYSSSKIKKYASFFIIDLWNPKSNKGQSASLVIKQINNEKYLALCEFPIGETNGDIALEKCVETTVENGKLILAKSWSRCFRKCTKGDQKVIVDAKGVSFRVPSGCSSGCLASIAVCGGATAILAAVAPPVSFFAAAMTFGICSGISCGVCFAICALGCQ
jgi:hypothetical protein